MARAIDATSSKAHKAQPSNQDAKSEVRTEPEPPHDVDWEISESSESSGESSSSSSSSSSSDDTQEAAAMRQPRTVAPQSQHSLMPESSSNVGADKPSQHRHRRRTYRREEDEAPRRTVYASQAIKEEMEDRSSRSFSSRQYSPAASYNQRVEASERARRSHGHARIDSTEHRQYKRRHSSREGSSKGYTDRGSDLKRAPPTATGSPRGGSAARPSLQRSNTASYRRTSWFAPLSDRRVSSSSSAAAPRAPLKRSNTEPRVMPVAGSARVRSPQATRKPLARENSVAGSERKSVSSGILSGLFGKPPPRGPVKR